MNRHAKRAVVGALASAVLVAVAWVIGWAFLPADIAANCWGCRIPMGFLGMILIGCIASIVYGLGAAVLDIATWRDE